MNVPMSFTSIHHRVIQALPWYVNGSLEGDEAGRVEQHLSVCPTCRSEAEGLAKMFHVHAASTPQRAVDEDQLDQLFTRIDRFEQESRQAPPRADRSWSELLSAAVVGTFGWLMARPVLVAGAFAVVFLGIFALPALQAPPAGQSYDVLSSPTAGANELRVKLSFRDDVTATDVQRLVAANLGSDAASSTYRIERRTEREYVVVFESKPGVATLSQWLNGWRSAPNVADAAVDSNGSR